MAINIFSGSSSKPKSNRPAATQPKNGSTSTSAAVQTGTQTQTEVKKGGLLSKVGDLAKKALPTALSFIPGVGGALSKVAEGVFNDPEWWQETPGNQIATNIPYTNQTTNRRYLAKNYSDAGPDGDKVNYEVNYFRNSILEFYCTTFANAAPENLGFVLEPTETQVAQWVLPAVRKVVNAVPLQSVADYRKTLQLTATYYAMWHQLKKYLFLLDHPQSYMPNLNTSAMPLLQNEAYPWLQSTVQRMESFLRASVRLPHTLCEVLAWRYGRTYRSNNSAKAAFVLYNVLDLTASQEDADAFIAQINKQLNSSIGISSAVTDLYNAYYDHDLAVDIKPETQCHYDGKEFVLRTNLDICGLGWREGTTAVAKKFYGCDPDIIVMDSELPNAETFMSSSISCTIDVPSDKEGDVYKIQVLMPVQGCHIWAYNVPACYREGIFKMQFVKAGTPAAWKWQIDPNTLLKVMYTYPGSTTNEKDGWSFIGIAPMVSQMDYGTFDQLECNPTTDSSDVNLEKVKPYFEIAVNEARSTFGLLVALAAAKSVDFYNADLVFGGRASMGAGATGAFEFFDTSAISIDSGTVTKTVMDNEQTMAFANLCSTSRKHSLSYKQAVNKVVPAVEQFVSDVIPEASVAPAASSSSKTK